LDHRGKQQVERFTAASPLFGDEQEGSDLLQAVSLTVLRFRERNGVKNMWPFDQNNQQYASAWDQGTYGQLPEQEVRQHYQQFVHKERAHGND
jgi:hypothetical protein